LAYTIAPNPGTISIAHGSADLIGVATNFTAFNKGALVLAEGFGIVGQLAADPTDDEAATLALALGGITDIAGVAYQIIPQSEPAVYSQRVRQMIETMQTVRLGMPMVMDAGSTADSDPGAGKVRFNNDTTPTIAYLSKTDALGNDISGRLAILDDSLNAASRAVLMLTPTDTANAYLDFDVTAALTDAGGYVKVPVALRAGAVPADKAQLAMTGIPSGKDGAPGVITAGSTGATDNALLRADGTGGHTAQTSSVIVDDSGNLTTPGSLGGSKVSANANAVALPAGLTGTLFQIAGADGVVARLQINAFAQQPFVTFARADGTGAAPSPVQSAEPLGGFGWTGYGTTAYAPSSRASIAAYAAENWSDTAQGTYFVFSNNPIGSAGVATERLRIAPDGSITLLANSLTVFDANGIAGLRSYTMATMPAAGAGSGAARLIYVTDSPGGGCIYISNGSVWAPVKTREICIVKPTDQTVASNTTPANDSALQFPMAPNTVYNIDLDIYFEGPATPGFKWNLTGPAGATLVRVERETRAPAATTYTVATDAAYTTAQGIGGNATTSGRLRIKCLVQNGATAGTFAFQWAQNTSNATASTVRAGSKLEYSTP